MYYSDKHQCYGVKVQVVVSPNGNAIHVSEVIPGRRHNAHLFRVSGFEEFMGRMEQNQREEKNNNTHAFWEMVDALV